MFCPKCGNADQQMNAYCRQCGTFLPDLDKVKKIIQPEEHLKANSVLNVMSAVGCLILAVSLYVMIFSMDDAPSLIYFTAAFLTAMFFWQAQIFWRNRLLKSMLPKRNTETSEIDFQPAKTKELLNEPNPDNFIPPSVVENTTRKLKVKR